MQMENSTPVPAAKPFDPRALPLFTVRTKAGKAIGQHMEVKYRLVWLREVEPNAKISTTLEEWTPTSAVFSARIELPNGAVATGWGSETAADFADFIMKAETKALGRACAALGFGTQFATEYRAASDETVDASTGEITGPQRDSPPEATTAPPAVPERGLDEIADPLDLERLIALWTQEAGQALAALETYCRDRYARELPQLSVQQCADMRARLVGKLAQRTNPKP
jgi:hypothetical protein